MAKKKETAPEALVITEAADAANLDNNTQETTGAQLEPGTQPEVDVVTVAEGQLEVRGEVNTDVAVAKTNKAKTKAATKPEAVVEEQPEAVVRFFSENPKAAVVYQNTFGGLFTASTPKALLATAKKYNNPFL